MTPLDLTKQSPRGVRATMLGFYFLPRTIDKLRAELPGGNLGSYINHDDGFSAYVIKRLGLEMDDVRAAVAAAPDEDAITRWLAERVDPATAPALNEKFESFVAERMSPQHQALLRQRHPVLIGRPDLTKLFDILEADDAHGFATALAVYGTLAPGRKNHDQLEALAGTWSEGTVRGRRVAQGWGNTEGYPAVRVDPAGDEIAVSVFESAELPAHWERLDAFEGDEYARVTAPVRIGDRIVRAEIYVARVTE